MRLLMWYLIVINIVTWIAFGLDKWKAKNREMAYPGADTPAAGSDWRLFRRAGGDDHVPA